MRNKALCSRQSAYNWLSRQTQTTPKCLATSLSTQQGNVSYTLTHTHTNVVKSGLPPGHTEHNSTAPIQLVASHCVHCVYMYTTTYFKLLVLVSVLHVLTVLETLIVICRVLVAGTYMACEWGKWGNTWGSWTFTLDNVAFVNWQTSHRNIQCHVFAV